MVGDDYTFGRQRSCWGRRTALEKVFIVFFTILLIAFVVIGVLIWTHHIITPFHSGSTHNIGHHASPIAPNASQINHGDPIQSARLVMSEDLTESAADVTHAEEPFAFEPPNRYAYIRRPTNLCDTDGCQAAIDQIRSFYDPNADPCDDFYQFACGGFLNRTTIPADQVAVNVFSEILDTLLVQLQSLVGEPIRYDDTKPFRLAKELYSACLNESLVEERGTVPIVDIVNRFGGWPVLLGDGWIDDEQRDWIRLNIELRRSGLPFDSIFGLSVQTDLLNSSMRTLDIDQSSLGLSREYLVQGVDNDHVQNYLKYMIDVAVALGANRNNAEKELRDALLFEIEVAKIGLPDEQRRNATALHNPMTIAHLQTIYPYILWIDYIKRIMPNHLNVTEDEIVVNTVPTFFAALGGLLSATPRRTVTNYQIWRTVESTVVYATKELRAIQQEFNRVENGQLEQEQRWRECIDVVSINLPISLSALYVRTYFNENSKHTAIEMVDNIRAAFDGILDQVQWMDADTLSFAKQKLRAMTTHIGYPDELKDDAALERYFTGLEVDSGKYLESALEVNTFQTNYTFGQLRETVNKTDWVKHSKAATVGAYYRSIENSIQFPAGILQGRFFSADRPSYMNYGAIGFVIAHEMTHGFDDKGRQFDDKGNVRAWWQKDTVVRYLEKADCIVEQYANYTDPRTQLKLNGLKTEGENIADNGGLKIAYAAYQRWAAGRESAEPTLPYLEWSPNQFFWMAAAQSWCTAVTPEHLEQVITVDFHSPDHFRVLGTFRNSPEFAADFQCPLGSRMNPVHKCGVW